LHEFTEYFDNSIQRTPRSKYIIKKLLKYAPSIHPDYELQQIAFEKISEITEIFALVTQNMQEFGMISDIQFRAKPGIHIIQPNRKLEFHCNAQR
jgi:hypothetical protein